jgi:hypothetical protein
MTYDKGSFAIPRVFHKRTNFDQDRFRPSRTNLKPEGPILRHVITARLALALSQASLCAQGGPPWLKKSKKLQKYISVY